MGLGPVSFSQLLNPESFESHILPGLLKFVKRHNSPLIVDFEGSEIQPCDIETLNAHFTENLRPRILISNFSISSKTENHFNPETFEIVEARTFAGIKTLSDIIALQYRINIPILSFIRTGLNEKTLKEIILNFSKINQNAILVATGVYYKTDMKKFGGEGMEPINTLLDMLQKESEEIANKVFKENAVDFFCWWKPEEKAATIVDTYTCSTCGKEYQTKGFFKDGNDFCTPPCFKQYMKMLRDK